MLLDATGKKKTSDTAFRWMVGTVVVTALLGIPHAVLQGWDYGSGGETRATVIMFATFASDTRYLFEELIYISALIFVGAKFFETRTTFAVTFDRVDATKISVKGPDEDNIVWIGQRYGNELEAQTVAAALENRLKENAA